MRFLKPITVLLALIPLLSVSCRKQVFREPDGGDRFTVSVKTLLPEPRVGLDAGRTAYVWTGGESVSVFNDRDDDNHSLALEDGAGSLEVPAGTTQLYAVYPLSVASESGPSAVQVSLPAAQTQASPGVLPMNYPMSASGTVSAGSATLRFSPLAGALALNIYRSEGYDAEERISKVTVFPRNNSSFSGSAVLDLTSATPAFISGDAPADRYSVTLTAPAPLGNGKPADARAYANQIYLLMARQSYTSLHFEIQTSSALVSLDAAPEYVFDCENFDFLLTNIDLSKGSVLVEQGVTVDSYSYAGDRTVSGLDDPVLRDTDRLSHDIIPDFSRVGYHYGDRAIITPAVRKTVSVSDVAAALAAGTVADTTEFLQNAIDEVGAAGGGTLLLRNGTYNICRILFIDRSNVVVRGESRDGTVIFGRGAYGRPGFAIGASLAPVSSDTEETVMSGRRVTTSSLKAAGPGGSGTYGTYYIVEKHLRASGRNVGAGCAIVENFVPCGRMYVCVSDPSLFSVGDRVVVHRPHNNDWISDIGMDKIASNGREDPPYSSPVVQWTNRNFESYFERRVMAIHGSRIYFDAPIVMSMEKKYGGGSVHHCTVPRVTECGVENLTIDSSFNEELIYTSGSYKGQYYDEAHTFTGVEISNAEHCWVRDVTTHHMGYALVRCMSQARCITVQDCSYDTPVSVISGGRRYALCIGGGAELCLYKNCCFDHDRHGCVTNGHTSGPNVYTACTGTNQHSVNGPHQSWAMGTLYDRITTNNSFEMQDRGNSGTGHGWTSGNDVFWNCQAGGHITCKSPWASARNYAVGCKGTKAENRDVTLDYFGNHVYDYYVDQGLQRPDGEWYPAQAVGETRTGAFISLPYSAADLPDWWPVLTLPSYSNPTSLYECQLEDRHARGIYLDSL